MRTSCESVVARGAMLLIVAAVLLVGFAVWRQVSPTPALYDSEGNAIHARNDRLDQPLTAMASNPVGSAALVPSATLDELRAAKPVRPSVTAVFRSVKGRDIKVLVFGSGPDTVLVMGGIHGDESAGVRLASELVDHLKVLPVSRLRERVVVMPSVNPDGYAAHTRGNAHGIDINRNFPTRDFVPGTSGRYAGGKSPCSEPETKAIVKVIEKYKPHLILSFHSPLGSIVYNGPAADIARHISHENHMAIQNGVPYPTPGSFGAHYGRELLIPVITIELVPKDDQWKRHGKALLDVMGVSGK